MTTLESTPPETLYHSSKRTLRWAAWLGWQLESNWTEPLLFILYVLVKPFSSSLLLVCMYWAVRQVPGTRIPDGFLGYLYIGNACFGLVGAVMFGMSQAVISDREHYRMLKYLFISPALLPAYLIGRAGSGAVQAVLGGVINIGLGMAFLPELRDALLNSHVQWGWLANYLLCGTVLLTALGMILSSLMLMMSRQGMYLSEGIAGLLYLACGVVFPLSILPKWFQPISLILPPTYWLEGIRRAIIEIPPERVADAPLTHWTHTELSLALWGSTLGLSVLAVFLYKWCLKKAWQRGRLEETTGV